MSFLRRLFGYPADSAKELSVRERGPCRVKPDETSAAAFLFDERIVLHGICITNMGGLACEPCQAVSSTVPDADLGIALATVLAGAKTAAVPDNTKESNQKLLKTVGFKSWRKLYGDAAHCSIWASPARITITPSTHYHKSAFTYLGEETVVSLSSDCAANELGQALRLGFYRCE